MPAGAVCMVLSVLLTVVQVVVLAVETYSE